MPLNKRNQTKPNQTINGCTRKMLLKCIEEKVDRNWTRILCAVFNKSWRQHHTKNSCTASNLPSQNYPSKTNKTCRSLLKKQGWTHKFSYGLLHMVTPVLADQQEITYISSVWPWMLFGGSDGRDWWSAFVLERIREIHAVSITWQWWW